MNRRTLFVISLLCLSLTALESNAQLPMIFSYQGILTDANGIALPDGEYTLTFALYNQESGGSPLWSEAHHIQLEKGVFNVLLGSTNSLDNVDFSQQLWLGISVNNQPEFQPRVPLTAVPYSLMAKRVEKDAIGSFQIADGSITLEKISTEGARKGQVIKYDGEKLRWDNDLVGSGGFALPFHDTVELEDTPAFWIEQASTGVVARFEGLNENGSYALDVRSKGNSPAIFVQHTNPLEIDANAIRAESEGEAATIYVEHHDGDGPAFKAWNFGSGGLAEFYADSSSRKPSLSITSHSNYNSTVAKFRYAPIVSNVTPKTPVVDIQTLGYASNSLRILDSSGSDHTIAVYKPKDRMGNERAKSALYIEGATDRYFSAPIAHFVQEGSGYGLRVEQKNTSSVAALAQFRNFGEGTGVQIITDKLRESLQTSELEASLYVENRSNSSSPVAYFYNRDTNSTGTAVSILHNGKGTGLRVERNYLDHDTTTVQPTAVFRGYSGWFNNVWNARAVVEIESRYAGLSNAGLALICNGGVRIQNHGFESPLVVKTNSPVLTAVHVESGDVEIADKLWAGAVIADDSSYISIGYPPLGPVLLQRSNSYFDGNVHIGGNLTVNGTVTKGGGSFRIDHPLDPENKYLYHFFVESPEMKNVYDGIAVCDENGEAVVTLPEWFEALNENFRYQLTCVGGYAPVYIKEEIQQNRFVIAGGKPGLKVSWQVTGVRKDKWALEHRMPIEQEKPKGGEKRILSPVLRKKYPQYAGENVQQKQKEEEER